MLPENISRENLSGSANWQTTLPTLVHMIKDNFHSTKFNFTTKLYQIHS